MSEPKLLPDGYDQGYVFVIQVYNYLDDGSVVWGRRLTGEEVEQVYEFLKGLTGEVMTNDGA